MYTGTVQVVPCSGETGYAFGTEGSGQGQLKGPTGITVYLNRLFIADRNNHRIQVSYQVHMATTSTITPETTTTAMTATATTMMTTEMTVTTKTTTTTTTTKTTTAAAAMEAVASSALYRCDRYL